MGKRTLESGLIEKMQEDLAIYPGVDFNFSQPISDNVEEAASGVKGSIAVKVFGKDLYESEKKAVEVFKVLETVDGIEDLGVTPEYRPAGATDRVERVSFSPLRRGQGGCTIHYRDGDRR